MKSSRLRRLGVLVSLAACAAFVLAAGPAHSNGGGNGNGATVTGWSWR
jgi:hypothetical protein